MTQRLLGLGTAFAGLVEEWLARRVRGSGEDLCRGQERRWSGEAEKRSLLVVELAHSHHSETGALEEVGLGD